MMEKPMSLRVPCLELVQEVRVQHCPPPEATGLGAAVGAAAAEGLQ